MIIIFVYVFPLKPFLFLVPKRGRYPLVSHALEKYTRIHNPEPSLLEVKPFGGVSDFLYSGIQIHTFFVSFRNFDIVNFKFP